MYDSATGIYSEESTQTLNYTVSQLGSVWINKFSLDKVDFCGTKNRNYVGGWTLELLDANLNIVAMRADLILQAKEELNRATEKDISSYTPTYTSNYQAKPKQTYDYKGLLDDIT